MQLFLVRERERERRSLPFFPPTYVTFSVAAGTVVKERKSKKKSLPRSCRFEIFNKDLIDAPCVLHVDGQGREWAHFTVGREGVREEEALVFKGNGKHSVSYLTRGRCIIHFANSSPLWPLILFAFSGENG